MTNECLLAYRAHVSENMHLDYSADVILVLLDEIIYWRQKYGNLDMPATEVCKCDGMRSASTICGICGGRIKAVVEVAKPCIECGETEKHLWGCKIGSMFDTPNIEEAAQLNARKEKIFGLLTEFRYKDTGNKASPAEAGEQPGV